MKYLLMVYASEAEQNAMPSDEIGKVIQAYGAYTDALIVTGALQAGERLRRSRDAALVWARKGKTEVLNQPRAEAREQLGGHHLIDAPDLDAALSRSARCPSSGHGTIEVRPIWAM